MSSGYDPCWSGPAASRSAIRDQAVPARCASPGPGGAFNNFLMWSLLLKEYKGWPFPLFEDVSLQFKSSSLLSPSKVLPPS